MEDFNSRHNIVSEDETLAEWVNEIARHVSYEIFQNQSKVIYMAGERGTGRKPMTKACAVDSIGCVVDDCMAVVRDCIVYGVIEDLHKRADVDLDMRTAIEYNEWNGNMGSDYVKWVEEDNE